MSSVVDHPRAYFRRWIPEHDALLRDMAQEAEQEHIPIVGPLVGELLFVLARTTGARRILELGTATGYSAIFLGRACADAGGRVITLEQDRGMAQRARIRIASAGLADTVRVDVGDAIGAMDGMSEPFDLVFLDIEKTDYIRALPHCHRLLRPGGLLIADNVGFADADPFNRAIAADPNWRSVSLFAYLPQHSPEDDGICLAVRL